MSSDPANNIKVTDIVLCGEAKVCITVELVVDAHCLADVGSRMLSAAAKSAATKKKKQPSPG
jgi:hypothetical protein